MFSPFNYSRPRIWIPCPPSPPQMGPTAISNAPPNPGKPPYNTSPPSGSPPPHPNFDDTDSFTYLFKAYWLDQKEKLSLTSEELNNARHPCPVIVDEESSDELYDVNDDHGSSSESSSGHHKINISSKRKVKSRSQAFTADKIPSKDVDGGGTVMLQETGWASNELLQLVGHMRNGDQSFISQFEVQALLLDYIKKYNLRDPRRKSQIICDLRLRNLFGKERVGHFEMLKLLELHFISKDVQVFAEGDQVEASDPDNKLTDDVEDGDMFARLVSEKRRKNRKRIEDTEPQANIDDYASIDVHNITQIFLRRSLVEELLNDIEAFNDKVVGSFVRIRISNSGQRQDFSPLQ
ncbi:Zinc finger CCCH domain-containing protein 44 [Platanthera guangdongensis]|uniref:Zinc finger CCCH domain-containing protein 44 n=1 Tax=Platanthera guangdongensis TaxID=2320717 RepID=A0ABR2MNS8_9ASPA